MKQPAITCMKLLVLIPMSVLWPFAAAHALLNGLVEWLVATQEKEK